MTMSSADARWAGDLKNGKGLMRTKSGSLRGAFGAGSRFYGSPGATPEELLGAAQAGCFAMALSAKLTETGYMPRSVDVKADVYLDQLLDDSIVHGRYGDRHRAYR